jgi:hypothetical protein
MEIWRDEANVSAAQKALYHCATLNRMARRGEYSAALENKATDTPAPHPQSAI